MDRARFRILPAIVAACFFLPGCQRPEPAPVDPSITAAKAALYRAIAEQAAGHPLPISAFPETIAPDPRPGEPAAGSPPPVVGRAPETAGSAKATAGRIPPPVFPSTPPPPSP